MIVLYRYEAISYAAPLDEYDRPRGPGCIEVYLREYPVVKTTPCGVWIQTSSVEVDKRFVRSNARKRFAHPTIEDAREAFRARKRREIAIYRARIARAERALSVFERAESLTASEGHV